MKIIEPSFPIVAAAFMALLITLPPTVQAKPFHFVIDQNIFFKNLEFNDISTIADGKTLTGSVLKPRFRFGINEQLDTEIGGVVRLNFGEDSRRSEGDPLVSIHYKPRPGFRLTGGTLDTNHHLLDAIYNDDLELTDPNEQGFQFQARTRHWTQDAWIDWEQQERFSFAEKFTLGNYTQIRKDGFMADFQMLWVHFGGQQNTAGGVINNLSLALGTGYTLFPSKTRRSENDLQNLGFSIHLLATFDDPNAGSNFADARDNKGVLGKLFARLHDTDFYLMSWSGEDNLGIRTQKGDLFYKSEHFIEAGIQKTWWLSEEVSLNIGFQLTKMRDQFVHTDIISFKWHGNYALFPEYLETLTQKENARREKRRDLSRIKRSRQHQGQRRRY